MTIKEDMVNQLTFSIFQILGEWGRIRQPIHTFRPPKLSRLYHFNTTIDGDVSCRSVNLPLVTPRHKWFRQNRTLFTTHLRLESKLEQHCNTFSFLAHLSRRLTRWAYRMGLEPASVRPSVRPCVRPHFQTWISPSPAGRLQPNFIWSIIGVGEMLH